MHIHRIKQGNSVYEKILPRESYREPGAGRSAVKKRTLLNLTNYPAELIRAIELALKHKDNLSVLFSADDIMFVIRISIIVLYRHGHIRIPKPVS
ncbi:MAG: hypothetical protein V1793_13355 [Pseudomonadota bacterium]